MRRIFITLWVSASFALAAPGRPEPEARTQMRILYLFVDISEVVQPTIEHAVSDLRDTFANAAKAHRKNLITANPIILEKSFWVKLDPVGYKNASLKAGYDFDAIVNAAVARYESELGLDIAEYEAVVLVHDLFEGIYPFEMKNLIQVRFRDNIRRTVFPLNYRTLGIRDN